MTDTPDYAGYAINQKLTSEDKIDIYRTLTKIRRFEQATQKPYSQDKMGGFLHLYIGQESVATGTISLCGEHDHVITAYRCHAHALACGMNMDECMAELYGKYSGCSKGKGGSMHFFDPDKNFWGGHGIVGGQTPLGLGLAYGVKYKGLKGCCLCYLGDGAINQGAFHESLNIAELHDVPVIYIIENNGYSMGTSQKRSSAYKDCLAQRAEAYDMAWDIVNGEDIYEVRAKTQMAIDRLWKERMINEGILTEESAKEIDTASKKEAAASVAFAEAAEYPPVSSIFDDVYWEVDNNTEAGNTGRHFFND